MPVVSFCRGIDELLEGGAKPGKVTPGLRLLGAGKTQLLLQLCVDATIPLRFAAEWRTAAFL